MNPLVQGNSTGVWTRTPGLSSMKGDRMILSPLTREEVEEKGIPRFSHSRMSTYNRCLYKGHLTYDLEIRPPYGSESPAMLLGTIIHRMVDLWYQGRSEDEVFGISSEEFSTYKEQLLYFHAFALFCRYTRYYPQESFTPIVTEAELFVPYTTPGNRKVALHVIIDVVAESPKGIVVIDHKTSGRPSWDGNNVWFDSQLLYYMAAMMLLGYDPKIGIINQVNTSKKYDALNKTADHDLFSRAIMSPSPRSLEGSLHEIGLRIDQILKLEQFPKNMTKDCSKYCHFADVCALEVQGIDSTPLRNKLQSPQDEEFSFDF